MDVHDIPRSHVVSSSIISIYGSGVVDRNGDERSLDASPDWDPDWTSVRNAHIGSEWVRGAYVLALVTPTPTNTPAPTATWEPTGLPVLPRTVNPPEPVPGYAWQTLVCVYDWPCDWALAVVYCESTNDPNAYNSSGPYVGLFQILNGSNDPATNIAQAYAKWKSGGTGHWPNCP